jgi:hypothetical protein
MGKGARGRRELATPAGERKTSTHTRGSQFHPENRDPPPQLSAGEICQELKKLSAKGRQAIGH